jgi:hypothetical protein
MDFITADAGGIFLRMQKFFCMLAIFIQPVKPAICTYPSVLGLIFQYIVNTALLLLIVQFNCFEIAFM